MTSMVAAVLVLAAVEDKDGRLVAIINPAEVASKLRCETSSVQCARNVLQKQGLIKVVHRGPKFGLVVFNEV